MKLLIILALCAIATNALPRRAPTFVIHEGRLVRSDLLDRSGRPSRSLGRVVGGAPAEPYSAPWKVSMQWGTVRPAHFCAASIINTNWILTAAHCTLAYPNFGIRTVVAGIHDLVTFWGTEQIRHVTLSNTWTHEDYDGFIGPHDISLLVFQTPFAFDHAVRAIALPSPGEIHTGIATIHGWGSISDTLFPEFPTVMHAASMPIVSLEQCRTFWDPFEIHDNHICAGGDGVAACELDDGGALEQYGEITGIVSWGGLPCGQPTRPSIYVRVSAYIDWIEDIMDGVRRRNNSNE